VRAQIFNVGQKLATRYCNGFLASNMAFYLQVRISFLHPKVNLPLTIQVELFYLCDVPICSAMVV
jgi:hypothetical protein